MTWPTSRSVSPTTSTREVLGVRRRSDMHVLFCNWRDLRNPEGGGSERYVEHMARGLAERGHQVTIACAAHDAAPTDEVVDGVRFVRHGSKMAVYAQTFWRLLTRRYGRPDVVVDVQNGLPFFTRLATRRPVVVLVHHVHREQWPVVYPGLVGRIGWWIESSLAPRLYRRSRYVAVSQATRDELTELGVDRDRITVIHNGTEPVRALTVDESLTPRMCVVGRLVPHKQVEHAIDALAALAPAHPSLLLDVVGSGWWEQELRDHAEQAGVADRVLFHGFVDDRTKHEILAHAWVLAMPSIKEGWGLVIGEAGAHGTPAVAYRSAGGTTESIDDKDSGVLVDTEPGFVMALREILDDEQWRRHLGDGARIKAHAFSWESSTAEFARLVESVAD